MSSDLVVELEALHLAHVRDVDAGPEEEVLIRHAAEIRHLAASEALEVEVRLLGVARDHGHGGERLAARQVAQRLGKEGHGLSAPREAEELDGRAMTHGPAPVLLLERPTVER